MRATTVVAEGGRMSLRAPAQRRIAVIAAVALSLAIAACGGGSRSDESSEGPSGAPVEGKQGGKLVELWTDDVDFIDPGQGYYQPSYQVNSATQRYLMQYRPDDSMDPVPDLAEAPPEVSPDGKTVTVKIRRGVKFSPPVDREVTSKDVKYAIERGFFNTVNNGYAGAYFGDVIGAKVAAKPGTKIAGIETPDDQTVVFKLKRGTGGIVAGAFALPLTAPVPESYAKPFDAKNPSEYGQHLVATGPYMIENDASGRAVGYEPGRRIHLVRNPNWDAATDYKPAYVDEIDIPQGNDDTAIASRRILDEQDMVSGDFIPPPAVLKPALSRQRSQLLLPPSGGIRYVAMDTSRKPLDNVDVRRAVVAGFDREALRLARGGRTIGDLATHILPPGLAGFEEAGGLKGPGIDFMSNPKGDPALSAEYFRKAGFASGKYEGDDELLMVGTSGGVAEQVALVAKENFERMGFKVRLRLVTQDAMYTKFCQVPSSPAQVCPNVGWLKDFSDPQTFLDPTFNGENIVPQGNSNMSELDVPSINAAMRKAETLVDPEERATAWAAIDRQISEQAAVIPYLWDIQPIVASKNVNPVVNKFNAMVDLTFTSIK
jgi:peptide/nickel transport system substrate-binding protein